MHSRHSMASEARIFLVKVRPKSHFRHFGKSPTSSAKQSESSPELVSARSSARGASVFFCAAAISSMACTILDRVDILPFVCFGNGLARKQINHKVPAESW